MQISTERFQVGGNFSLNPRESESLQVSRSPHLLLFDSLLLLLLLSPSVSLGWILPQPISPLPAQGCSLSTSLPPPFLVLSYLSFLCSTLSVPPAHLLSPSWICFTLHCSRNREDPGWMSHPLTICCPKALQASAPFTTPLLSTGTHGCTSMHPHVHACTLDTLFFSEERNACTHAHDELDLKWTEKESPRSLITCLRARMRGFPVD